MYHHMFDTLAQLLLILGRSTLNKLDFGENMQIISLIHNGYCITQ